MGEAAGLLARLKESTLVEPRVGAGEDP